MKHYLKTLEETIRQQWDQKSLCDYEGDSFTYADVATSIEQFRIFLVEAGITKRSKIAICARNCARWAMIFWDINVNECVAVPLLADFHPNSITTFTHHSDSVLLFTDKEIWDKLNPGQMPNLRAAINVKDRSMLWHRDELVAEAWENREKAFAQKHPTGFTRAQVSYPSDNMDKLAIINYTSGTTGNPKGVMLTYGAISDTDAFSNSHFRVHPSQCRWSDGLFPWQDTLAHNAAESHAGGEALYGGNGAAGNGEGVRQFHQARPRQDEMADGHTPGPQGDLQTRPQEGVDSLWRSGTRLHHGRCCLEARGRRVFQ